jgi:hypothetical protein
VPLPAAKIMILNDMRIIYTREERDGK